MNKMDRKPLSHLTIKVNRAISQLVNKFLVKNSPFQLEKLGSDYGGWIVPSDLIQSDWICYSGGVGEDITFDFSLINKFNCNVYAFDPTPRAKLFVDATAGDINKFHFYNFGLWSENSVQKFFAPANPEHVSHSILNLQSTTQYFEASCKRLSSIMSDLGHQKLDLLKIDIEGAEYGVLSSLIEDKIDVQVLCVEFDQPMPYFKTLSMILKLLMNKFALISVEGWNYTFIKACLVEQFEKV